MFPFGAVDDEDAAAEERREQAEEEVPLDEIFEVGLEDVLDVLGIADAQPFQPERVETKHRTVLFVLTERFLSFRSAFVVVVIGYLVVLYL